jgi:cell division protein FtsN
MAHHTGKKFRQLVLVVLSVGCGYGLAVLYDAQQVKDWFNLSPNGLLVTHEVNKPAPKLEFYTLLSQPKAERVLEKPIAEKVAEKAAEKVVVVNHGSGYIVQLASFQRQEDADRLKASLAMSGFEVKIHSVLQQNVIWYRVVLGPFVNRMDAQQMQTLVSRKQRIAGIVRKLDV